MIRQLRASGKLAIDGLVFRKDHKVFPMRGMSSSVIPTFIEIGVNLDDDMFKGKYHGKQAHQEDLKEVIERARKAGVIKQIITVGQISEIPAALALTRQYEGLYCTAGVHPTRTSHLGSDKSYLQELSSILHKEASTSKAGSDGKIVAIGECGLDYDRLHFSSKEDQRKHFDLQLQLAIDHRLPLFLHCRNAHEDFVNILKPKIPDIGQACRASAQEPGMERSRIGVVHCFTGTVKEMQELVDLGLFIGLTGCSFKDQEGIKVAKAVPLDKLLLETDAPWCDMRPTHASAPYLLAFKEARSDLAKVYQPDQVKKEKWESNKMVKGRNEPCTIGCVAAVIAQVKKITIEEVAEAALNNSRFLFGL